MGRSHIFLRDLGIRVCDQPERGWCEGQILIIDDEETRYAGLIAPALKGCRFREEACAEAGRLFLLSTPVDLVILNHSANISAPILLPLFKSLRPSVPIIITTASGSEDLAVEVFRHGAIDYIKKPLDIRELELKIRAILEIREWHKDKGKAQPITGLQRALRLIEAHYNAPISLNQVAHEAGMSISCFEKHLKEKTGMTFTGFVNSLRVVKAKEMIKKEGCSMLQVSLACGFGTQSHFNRIFKKIAGLSPREYRKSLLIR
jgi:AraC-like DNA-binding protein